MHNKASCYQTRMFIDRHGDIYPCCFKNNDSRFIIANIRQEDAIERCLSFDVNCSCDFHIFRKLNENEKIVRCHMQTSLQCHGSCAVCYVGAPLKGEKIEVNYDQALSFLSKLAPSELFLEGGEVPIQKNAMEFAEKIKDIIPLKRFHLLTNGCYPTKTAERIASIFESISVSFMAFSNLIYFIETGLDVKITKQFFEYLYNANKCMGARFIVTPLSICDIGNFVDYISNFKNIFVTFADSNLYDFVKNTPHIPYWSQVINRSEFVLKKSLVKNNIKNKNNKNTLWIEPRTARLFSINKHFVNEFSLCNIAGV